MNEIVRTKRDAIRQTVLALSPFLAFQ